MILRATVTGRPCQEEGILFGVCGSFATPVPAGHCVKKPDPVRACRRYIGSIPIKNYVLDCPSCDKRKVAMCPCPDGQKYYGKEEVVSFREPCSVPVKRGKAPFFVSCCKTC